jgi:peptide deformylase
MALLPILEYPDPRLKKVAAPLEAVTDDIRALIRDMAETMYAAPGIGLAAVQVNEQKRIVVIDISEARNELHVFVNPELTSAEGEQECEEGCLSVPGYYEKVRRAEKVTVRALDSDGKPFELRADGLLAVCIQHEIDHLDGKVFVEYLSPLKQQRLKNRIRKRQREAAAA